MGTVSRQLDSEARSIFDDLGYTVSSDGNEITAERKWRRVYVTPMAEPDEVPSSGQYRCFVTRAGNCSDLERQLRRRQPKYDWAIMGIDETGEYEVYTTKTGW